MRTTVVVIAFLGACAPGVILAQAPAAPPTRVCEIGLYGCPSHAEIRATWPAQCPTCGTVLSPVPVPRLVRVSVPVDIGPMIDMDARRRDEDEKARQARQEELAREQTRRNAEAWGRYPNYGYYPPGTTYQYPYNYYYNPGTGQYEFRNPQYAYPYGAYSYNPGTGQYSYNPGMGQYSYNPNTGQYQYMNPGSAYPNRGNENRGAGERR